MTFKEWLFSEYQNPSQPNQWGLLHILALIIAIGAILLLSLAFSDKKQETRYKVVKILMKIILIFEITRRVIGLCKIADPTLNQTLYILLPRPWCAFACWSIIIAVTTKKQFMYNFASIIALICSLIFFAYPEAGFNNEYILFENLYSIVTHTLLLITSVVLITLKFTKFEFKTCWKELVCFVIMIAYGFLEIFVLDIATDPMYFMPNGDIQHILGVSYPVYLILYILFLAIFISSFYLISNRKILKERLNISKKHN